MTTLGTSITTVNTYAAGAYTHGTTQANNALNSAKTHANTQANNALNSAKEYTDTEVNTAVVTLGSNISDLATTLSNAQTAIATRIGTVESNVGTLNTSVTTLSSSIDGVRGTYGVSIDNNGHFSGFALTSALADGGNVPYSTFSVRADRFEVVDPSQASDTMSPFVVADGTVYVNGAQIKPGSIAANRIVANELSAINANMGTITAGVMRNSAGTFEIDLDNGTITISV